MQIENATQAEVDEACKALKAAREALVEKEEPSVPENVDKAAAQKYYDDCLAYYEKAITQQTAGRFMLRLWMT